MNYKKENIAEELGLDDKDIQKYLKKNPDTAESIAKMLIAVDANRMKRNKLHDALKALGQRYISAGGGAVPMIIPPEIIGEDFSYNKSLVVVLVLFIVVLFFGIILYFRFFYYQQ